MDTLENIMIQAIERVPVLLDSNCAEAIYGTCIPLDSLPQNGLNGIHYVSGVVVSKIFNS